MRLVFFSRVTEILEVRGLQGMLHRPTAATESAFREDSPAIVGSPSTTFLGFHNLKPWNNEEPYRPREQSFDEPTLIEFADAIFRLCVLRFGMLFFDRSSGEIPTGWGAELTALLITAS